MKIANATGTKRKRRNPKVDTEGLSAGESPPSLEESLDKEREFTVKLGVGVKEHVVKGNIRDNVLTALRASKDVSAWMDKEKGKNIYLIGKEGIKGCVNLGMPLKYMPDGSQFEMKFYNCKRKGSNSNLHYRQYGNRRKNCVLFYVAPTAKKYETNEPLSRNIIRCKQLLNENCSLCVFAPGNETIKDALYNDGRFMPNLKEEDWKVMEENKVIPITRPVKGMSNKTFTIHVATKRQPRSGKGPNKEQLPLATQEQQYKPHLYFNKTLLTFYPDLKEQISIINGFFGNTKQQERTDVFGVYKEVFGKEKKNSIWVKELKLHANRSASIGYIEWGTTVGKEGVATCFVLCGSYVLTCHHVVMMIVGEGTKEEHWASKIGQLARVTFSYEDRHPEENDWFSLEEWFEVSDRELDFAVLKLKENGNKHKIPAGLVQFSFAPPFNGLIYIIGHPDGEAKSVDGCCVVSVCERQQECTRRLQQEKETECNCFNCGYEDKGKNCIHMYNPRIPEITNNPDMVTYDTSFFRGSSGSPVFDRNGNLVALHAAGYLYGGKCKQRSIIEYGYLMMSILSKMEKKHESWYQSEIFPVLQAGPDGREAVVHDNHLPQDVEMEPVDNI